MARIIDTSALEFFGIFAGAALVLGMVVGAARGEAASTVFRRGLEGAALAALGGFLARAAVSLLLTWGNDSPGAARAVGGGLLFWPGVVDGFLWIIQQPPLFTPKVLLWVAAGVGSFAGMMNGIWGIHDWTRLGFLTFLLDVTWGLAGTTNGCLVHLFNFAWAGHKDDPRSGAHLYLRGFAFKAGYAFTQGAVMSNLQRPAGSLVDHEGLHVSQNRIFGPLYIWSYLGWMALLFLPALIVGCIRKDPGNTIMGWCYANNPWEAWAYGVGGHRDPNMVWSTGLLIATAVPYYLGVIVLFIWILSKAWLDATTSPGSRNFHITPPALCLIEEARPG